MNKFVQMVISFLKKLFSSSGDVGSKRVVGFGAFMLIAACVIVNLCGGTIVAQFIFWGLLLLVAACFGLNALIEIFAMKSKTNLAQDVIKEEPEKETSDAAKEIIQAEKP